MPDELSPTHVPAGTWRAGKDELQSALAHCVRAPLDELGVIVASGADAATFLHTQLTNDIENLPHDHVIGAGYCTAKGRLLATLSVWRDRDNVFLQLPLELAPGVQKRLSMFVLRAKAGLADDSAAWSTWAVLGPGSADQIRAMCGVAPAVDSTVAIDGALITRLRPSPRVQERFVVRARNDAWRARLSSARVVSSGVFWWSQIDAGLPDVFAVTQDRLVPQMINLDVLGAVNFKKGCYPGQEIVARSQYIGKLRRRMSIAHANGPAGAGIDVYAAGMEQPVGAVVMAAAAPEGGMDLLFECPSSRLSGELRVADNDDPLCLRPLPYELIDPTV